MPLADKYAWTLYRLLTSTIWVHPVHDLGPPRPRIMNTYIHTARALLPPPPPPPPSTCHVPPRPQLIGPRIYSVIYEVANPVHGHKEATKVNGFNRGDNSLLKPIGIQIATNYLPGPPTREHRGLIHVKMVSLGTIQHLLSGLLPNFQNPSYKLQKNLSSILLIYQVSQ